MVIRSRFRRGIVRGGWDWKNWLGAEEEPVIDVVCD